MYVPLNAALPTCGTPIHASNFRQSVNGVSVICKMGVGSVKTFLCQTNIKSIHSNIIKCSSYETHVTEYEAIIKYAYLENHWSETLMNISKLAEVTEDKITISHLIFVD